MPPIRSVANEEGELKIRDGIAAVKAGLTRLNVLTADERAGRLTVAAWRNVEMTVYVKARASAKTLDYQSFYLSARSCWRHDESVPCEGTSYHADSPFRRASVIQKGTLAHGRYTQLRPDPGPSLGHGSVGRWIGMKFVCRNFDSVAKLKLQLHLDAEERTSGNWRLSLRLRRLAWREAGL